MITIHTSCQQCKKNPPFSPAYTTAEENHKFEAIKKLIDIKLRQIEESISSDEQQIKVKMLICQFN